MLLTHSIGVLLAPAAVSAAAFPWAIPEPTIFAPAADTWSPAPTPAPYFPGFELFKRQTLETDNTCGFLSGSPESSITCFNPTFICATNTQFGVHGCCDPNALSSCTIPTTCVPAAAMATACTDAACSSNSQIVKCTDSAMPECYRWIFQYSKTSMTQHGCAETAFTLTAARSWGASSVPGELYRTVTVVASPSNTPTPTLAPPSSPTKKPSLGLIVGATIGGCTVVSILALAGFILHRRRNQASPKPPVPHFHDPLHGVTEYNPHGFPTTAHADKAWRQQHGPVARASDAMPQYPGMGAGRYGIVEVDGLQRPVEVDAEGEGGGYKYVVAN